MTTSPPRVAIVFLIIQWPTINYPLLSIVLVEAKCQEFLMINVVQIRYIFMFLNAGKLLNIILMFLA